LAIGPIFPSNEDLIFIISDKIIPKAMPFIYQNIKTELKK